MAYGIDLILLDLNAIKLSVDCVMRVLGGSDMLGDQLSNRDIPVVALSTHTSQRKDCSKQQGMYFVLKPPKPIPFFFVIRSALARHHNLQMARDQKRMQHEYSPTPDMYSDSLRMKNIDYENDNGINHEINETVELLYANPNIHAPSPLPLPFPETASNTNVYRRSSSHTPSRLRLLQSNSSSRSSSRSGSRSGSRGGTSDWSQSSSNNSLLSKQDPKRPSSPKSTSRNTPRRSNNNRNTRSAGSQRQRDGSAGRLRLTMLTEAENLMAGFVNM